jgi:ribosomal protein S18 acetylase RimI-like enzyme
MSYINPSRKKSKKDKEILLRNATVNDANEIALIKSEIIGEEVFMLRELAEANINADSEKEEISEHLNRDGSVYIVAEFDGHVIGFLEFLNGSLKRIRHSGMFSMYIRKDFREEGIGSLLLEELIRWAESDSLIEKLTLAVFSTNTRARKLYEKFGFIVEGNCPHDMKLSDGTYIDSILMYRFVK